MALSIYRPYVLHVKEINSITIIKIKKSKYIRAVKVKLCKKKLKLSFYSN